MNGITILQGDVREVLKTLPDESVNCVVTSPPYWGLRDYGLPPQVWPNGPRTQGVVRCNNGDHLWEDFIQPAANGIVDGGMSGETLSGNSATRKPKLSAFCKLCGAWRGCYGLEPTPQLYIVHSVEIFRELWRVLREDGTLWLNLGDSYAQGSKGNSGPIRDGDKQGTNIGGLATRRGESLGPNRNGGTKGFCKPKDLCGIPWMVALALRDDGWYLRSDIIWHKPNPMPESVQDRPTKAHEYIFLLSKSERYFYDFERVLEPVTGNAHARGDGVNPKCYNGSSFNSDQDRATKQNIGQGPRKAYKMPDGWDTGPGGHGSFHRNGREKGKTRPRQNPSFSAVVNELVEARNKRSVWTVPTQAFPEAHFATFPEELIKPCILAGCPAGGTVLDPFFGSGTTGLVARANGCKCIGIELNPEYIKIAERRLAQEHLEFADVIN